MFSQRIFASIIRLFQIQASKLRRFTGLLQKQASFIVLITSLICYTNGEVLSRGCTLTRSNSDGLCLSSGSVCCTTEIGDSCSRQNANPLNSPPRISIQNVRIFVLEERNLVCWNNLTFREKNGSFSRLIGIRAEIKIHKHSLFDHLIGQRVNEFVIDPKIAISDVPGALQSITMCMFSGYNGKLSDLTSDPRTYLELLLSTIPPTVDELPHSIPRAPIQLSKIPKATIKYEGCRVHNITFIPFENKEVPSLSDWAIIGSVVIGMFLLAGIGALLYRKSKPRYHSVQKAPEVIPESKLDGTPDREPNRIPQGEPKAIRDAAMELREISPEPFSNSQDYPPPPNITPAKSSSKKKQNSRKDSIKDGETLT